MERVSDVPPSGLEVIGVVSAVKVRWLVRRPGALLAATS